MHPERGPRRNRELALQSAFAAAHFRMMVHSSRVFLPVTAATFCIVAWLIHGSVPLWLALPVPLLAALRCVQQFIAFHRNRSQDLAPHEIEALVALRGRTAVITATIVSLWGLVVSFMGPRDVAYLMSVISGFMAFGTVTYTIYGRSAMRLVLVVVGLPMLIVFGWRLDPFGLVIFLAYAANALLLQRALATHFDNVQTAVRKELDVQLRFRDAQKASAEIAEIANTDELTGVTNRRGFLTLVSGLIDERRGDPRPFALGVIDLDGFKPVNDCYGHAAGDLVLIEVARRLERHIGDEGIVARIGGDEFAVVYLDATSDEDLIAAGQRLIQAVSTPIELPQASVRVSGSCGFAVFPEAGMEPATLLERADEALYSVKADRRAPCAIYDFRTEAGVVRQAALRQRLPLAIEAGLIHLYYQPIVETSTGSLRAFEALARWQDEQAGDVSPAEFIPLAERCGLIGELTRRLFRDAVREAATWPRDVRLSFNLSAVLFVDETIGLDLLTTLSDSGLLPSRVVLEITETALMKRPDEACAILERLRAMGIAIAIDDFGTGYSSFGQLHRLPVDILKIDRIFFGDLEEGSQLRDIASTMVSIGRRLGLRPVAEGIETPAQRDFAAAIGCQSLQGYLFGAPMPAEQLPDYWKGLEKAA